MAQLTEKSKIVLDYSIQYKDWKNLTLAKKIMEENPGLFNSVETCRKTLCNHRGLNGVASRHTARDIKEPNYDTRNSVRFKDETKAAKILVLDIETAPIKAFVWGIWQQNVGIHQIQNDWFCFTWAAKWLFEDKVYSGKLTSKEAIKQDDSRMMKGIWSLLNEADIIITHNGEKFDIPRMNSRFILNGMKPPSPYASIDTLKHIRRQFGFSSNKLDYVNKLLKLERKEDTGGFELWEKCYSGDKDALDKMESYNITDVKILEETYLKIRAWIKPHPPVSLYIIDDHDRCPTCGSNDLIEEGKEYVTTASRFTVFRCNNCQSTGRKRKNNLTVKDKRTTLLSIPK